MPIATTPAFSFPPVRDRTSQKRDCRYAPSTIGSGTNLGGNQTHVDEVSVRSFPAVALLGHGKIEDVKRTRPILIPFLLVALLLHGNPLLAVPEHDTGYFQWVCNGAQFAVTKMRDFPSHQVFLNLEAVGPIDPRELSQGSGWISVSDVLCTSKTKCESATQAKLQLDEFGKNHKQISGKYSLDVGSQHLEGSFVLKFQIHHDKAYVCIG